MLGCTTGPPYERILGNKTGFRAYDPLGGVRQGLMIDSSVLVNALNNNALRAPEKLHVQRAVFDNEKQSVRRELFERLLVENDQAQRAHGSR